MTKILSLAELTAIRDVAREGKMTAAQTYQAIDKLLAHIEASRPKGFKPKLANFEKGAKVLVRIGGQNRQAEILGFDNGFYSAKVFPVKRGKIVIREYLPPNLIVG